ncbi:MAG TPA: bifunctional UDP-N-acetylglucosamine diphosphorylase/glucosamine-1-phosphate N-acetyltransferase GlmU [Candidatus Binatia bacterium]|nr:bifunctional UDP-N-acetylglucosamine diphosphorylase/glucosamine-1-phosphate N-acetyltransferase GlmU [Candidatus Binatia bacterium]
MNDVGVIILAAGLGRRMKSRLPKVMHPLSGKPLLCHVLSAAQELEPDKLGIIIGHGAEAVRQACRNDDISWVVQERQLGTGHAVRCAKSTFREFAGDILILSGDVPLISKRTLNAILHEHRQHRACLTLVTTSLKEPQGYGRVLRDADGEIAGVVEERDATDDQRQIEEINAGIYVASAQFLFSALEKVKNHNEQSEYYLPDIVVIALQQGEKVATVKVDDAREVMGINTREELAQMEKTLQERINRKWMDNGVTLKDPNTTYIDKDVVIGKDTVIGPNTHLLGNTVIGERCQIDGSAYLTDVHIGDEVQLKFSVVMTRSRVAAGAIIGPFAHLRPGSALGANVHIGNFVETKEATLGENTKANHLAYLGDVTVGRDANIGAGTIVCNYDGFKKYRSKIGDRVQVGSDSTLVAPIALGDDVYVATATTLRHDVPAGALAFNERQERVREGWTAQKREKMKGIKK